MKKLFTLVIIILAMVVSSCTYDDTAVWNKLEDHESRISTLEELCREMNTNISALQSLVDAMQGGDYITSIVPVTKDGNIIGYTLTFAKAQSITIYHGKDGQNGADGKDSDFVPTIGVKQDTDGIYYWTLDGEWLLDDNDNKIKAVSTDGKDGITPQLKIEEGYWYVSYDNGTSWTQLGKAMGEDSQDGANGADGKDGDSFFQSVIQDENNVYFTLADGTVITLPKGLALSIEFAESDLVVMSPNTTREIGYTVTSATATAKVEVTSSADIKAKAVVDNANCLTGKIHITTGDAIDEYSKVIVFVSNGDKVIMRSITFEEAGLVVEEDATKQATSEGGEMTLEFLSNVECEVVIPEEAQSWISVVPATRAMEKQTITLKLEPNEGYYRSATVTVQSSDGTLKLEYQVEQEGELGVEIGPTQIPDNQIWYTSTDGTIVEPKDGTVSGGTLVSNTYVDGVGIMTFSSDVTALNQDAFNNRDTLKSIILPNSLISIGNSAFRDCTSLTSVTIPDSVTSIGNSAFYSCDSLTSVTIPDSVTEIGESAFNGCSGELIINSKIIETDYNATNYPANSSSGWLYESRFTKLTIGDNITEIGNYAFSDCTSLTSVTIGNSVTSIGNSAFRDCTSLTNVTIPDSVTTIGDYAFYSCSSLTSVTIGNSVTSIGKEAFRYCRSLTSVTIGNSVTSIGKWAFSYCTSLTSVTIPDSVTSIGDYTFGNCTSLTSVTIPDSVTSIGESALCGCTSLTSVTIPDSVTSIGRWAFLSCTSLKEVYCKPTTPPAGGSSMFDENASGRKIYVPSNSVSAYKSASGWSYYSSDIVGYDF